MNKSFMKPMVEILSDFTPAYPYDEEGTLVELWEKGFQICREDSDVVKNLTTEYKRDGAFREPIIISDEGDILNGMHRLTVLNDLGVEEAYVRVGYREDTHDFLEVLGTTHLTSDEVFDIYEETMSVPFAKGFWLQFDFLSTQQEGRKTRLTLSTFDAESVHHATEITAWVKENYSLETVDHRITNMGDDDEDETILSIE